MEAATIKIFLVHGRPNSLRTAELSNRSGKAIAAQPGPWVGPFHWNNRRLRVPEIAAIQTLPSEYKFFGTRRSVQKQIGNSVPCLLGQRMIEYLIDILP